jgi:hypothetical protein
MQKDTCLPAQPSAAGTSLSKVTSLNKRKVEKNVLTSIAKKKPKNNSQRRAVGAGFTNSF